MAAIDRRFALLMLLCTGFTAMPLHGDTPVTQQQWNCRPADGTWSCQREALPAGPYPSARPVLQHTQPAPATSEPPQVAASSAALLWNWVPTADLSEAQRCKLGPGCAGTYVEPARDWPEADQPSETAPIRAHASSSEWQGDTVVLEGNVEITRGQRKVTAHRAELDRGTERAVLTGQVQLLEPGMLLAGDRADIDTVSGLGTIEQARILGYASGARAEAQRLSRTAEHLAILKQARYTQCTPEDEIWSLSAREIQLNNETGRGTARHSVLRLGPVPVAYSPWVSFPIDDRRQSGWLWPSISSSDGGDVSAPYYLNLAPHYDATLTPRYIGDRGAMLETELRHLSRFGATRLSAAGLPDDDLEGEDRWLFSGQHEGDIGRHIATRVDYTKVSDGDYFRDLNVSSLDVRRKTHLDQRAELAVAAGNWRSNLRIQQYQTLEELVDKPYRRLPQWTVQRRSSQRNFQLDYTALMEYTDFDHDDSIRKGGRWITGQRLYGEVGLTLPMHWAAGYIQPTIKMRHVGYELDDLPYDASSPVTGDKPSASTPQAILDAGLFFERDSRWFGNDYLQTLEPRLYYLWSEHQDQSDQPLFDTSRLTFSYQQLFRPFRFTGYDRLEDFDQLSLGITNRWIQRSTGRELVTASIGQIFYFSDRQVEAQWLPQPLVQEDNVRKRSELAAELRVQASEHFWVSASTLWDTDEDVVNEGGMYLHYATSEISGRTPAIFNLGYRYRRAQPGINHLRRDIEQTDISAAIPIGLRWSLFARFNYDLDDRRSLEDMFGLQYEDCCWLARVVYQRAVEGDEWTGPQTRSVVQDHAIIFEFQLKGLGSLGSTASGLLQESILGYRERD